MGEGLDLPEELLNTPIRALGTATRRLLSWYLDPPADIMTSEGLTPDITGVADLAGFDAVFIRYLETRPNKTVTFIDAWGYRNNATVGNLVSFLSKLERFDCICDIKESLVNDVTKWKDRSRSCHKDGTFRNAGKTFHSESKPEVDCTLEQHDEEDNLLTTHDVASGILQRYTACICCSDSDLDLAELITDHYTDDQSNFRFFIPQEHLLGGRYEFETTAEVIENRCDGRLVVIMSKSYLTSSACTFATQFAKTLDPDSKRRKLIPIVKDENIVYPRVLRGITTIKAHRLKHGDSFWRLLTSSLSSIPRELSPLNPNQGRSSELDSKVPPKDIEGNIVSSNINNNISEDDDTSDISRDSLRLRAASFGSTSDYNEKCEKYEHASCCKGSITPDNKIINWNRTQILSEADSMEHIHRTGSVPSVLEPENSIPRECNFCHRGIVNSGSSQSLTLHGDSDKSRKRDRKNPKQWLLSKLFKSLDISDKTNKNTNQMRTKCQGQLNLKHCECQPSSLPTFHLGHKYEESRDEKTESHCGGKRSVTVPLAKSLPGSETSGGAVTENNSKSTTEISGVKRMFTMDL